jgi:hypothetical protein
MFSDKFILNILDRSLPLEIKQKIRTLKLNQEFIKDCDIVKKNHKGLIGSKKKLIKKFCKDYYGKGKVLKKKTANLGFTAKESESLSQDLKKTYITEDHKFKKDILDLAKKYKLYPLYYWEILLIEIIAGNWLKNPFHFSSFLVLASFFRGTNKIELRIREDSKTKEENIWILLNDGCTIRDIKNCWKRIKEELKKLKNSKEFTKNKNLQIIPEKNPYTEEKELWLCLPDDYTIRDILSSWKKISDKLKEIKISKKNIKRHYPLRNLEIAEKINKTEKETDEWYEPTDDTFKEIKESDFTIIGEIFDQDFLKEKEEKRAVNKLRQIRFQYKRK